MGWSDQAQEVVQTNQAEQKHVRPNQVVIQVLSAQDRSPIDTHGQVVRSCPSGELLVVVGANQQKFVWSFGQFFQAQPSHISGHIFPV